MMNRKNTHMVAFEDVYLHLCLEKEICLSPEVSEKYNVYSQGNYIGKIRKIHKAHVGIPVGEVITFEKKGKYYFYGWPEYGINEPRYIDRCFVYSEGEM